MHSLLTRSTILLVILYTAKAEIGDDYLRVLPLPEQNSVKINKCCKPNELMVNFVCRLAEEYSQSVWVPEFKTEDGKNASVKYFHYVNGVPNCAQQRPVFGLAKSDDELRLLSDGRLQHLIHHSYSTDIGMYSLQEEFPTQEATSSIIHDQDKYCLDKILIKKSNITGLYALVCIPEVILKTEEMRGAHQESKKLSPHDDSDNQQKL